MEASFHPFYLLYAIYQGSDRGDEQWHKKWCHGRSWDKSLRTHLHFLSSLEIIKSCLCGSQFSILKDAGSEGVKSRREYKIDHFQQQDTWDCGLACVLMILPSASRQYFIDHFQEICTEGGFGRSTWTIDLSYILRKFNIRHIYLTKTIGINPEYYKHNYYNKLLIKDEARVNFKLKNAESNGVRVDEKTVRFDELILHLSKHGPIILLTNSAYLCCDICRKDRRGRKAEYSGHYVVLCGYDLLRKQILYRNPARSDHMCVTTFDIMDEARTAFGTDEDIIFIFDSS